MSLPTYQPSRYTAQLSPADQIAPLSHTNIGIAIPSRDSVKASVQLERSIHTFCEQLPYVAGRIYRGKGGYTYLTWSSGDQVHFERKMPTGPLPTYEELQSKGMPLQDLEHDFRPTGNITREYQEYAGDVWQAMLASYTLLDGGIIICIALHHHLAGGTACTTLIHRLASICRGSLDAGDHPASLDAMAPLGRFKLVTKALGVETGLSQVASTESYERSAADTGNRLSSPAEKTADLSIRVFSIQVSSLDALRDTLADHLGGSRPSSTAVLAGLMWCIFGQARSRHITASDDDVGMSASSLVLPVPASGLLDERYGVRSKDFIGNLLSAAVAREELSTLATQSVGQWPLALPAVVEQLASAIQNGQEHTRIQNRLRQVMTLSDMRVLSQSSSMGTNDLLVTNWGGLPMSFDFGPDVGRSEFVRPLVGPITQRTTSRTFYSYVVILPKIRQGREEIIEMVSCFERGDMAVIEQNSLLTRLQKGPSRL